MSADDYITHATTKSNEIRQWCKTILNFRLLLSRHKITSQRKQLSQSAPPTIHIPEVTKGDMFFPTHLRDMTQTTLNDDGLRRIRLNLLRVYEKTWCKNATPIIHSVTQYSVNNSSLWTVTAHRILKNSHGAYVVLNVSMHQTKIGWFWLNHFWELQGGSENGATDSWPSFCQTLTDSTKNFTGRFLGKFAVKQILKIPPHLAYVATLPCETLMSAKQDIDDKLQSNVSTYLRCGGVVNNQINEGL